MDLTLKEKAQQSKERLRKLRKRKKTLMVLLGTLLVLFMLASMAFYSYSVFKCDDGKGDRTYCHVVKILEFFSSHNDY